MGRPKLDKSEVVVRALTTAEWDKRNGRKSPSLFEGEGTSLSRLQIFSLPLLIEVFHRDLDSPRRIVNGAGLISVAQLSSIGEGHKEKATTITVEADPTPNNEAHAEIPEKITRGLSRKIVAALDCRDADKSVTQWATRSGQRALVFLWRKFELWVGERRAHSR